MFLLTWAVALIARRLVQGRLCVSARMRLDISNPSPLGSYDTESTLIVTHSGYDV
jgi:hypothetical protein